MKKDDVISRYEDFIKEQSINLTVFVTTYNRADYLKETINSILTQTYTRFALVVLDNHSTDETKNVINTINDHRVFLISHEKNIGGCDNLNFAIDMAQTEFYMIFHDDDIMHKQLLEEEIRALQKNNCDIVACSKVHIDENGTIEREAIFSDSVKFYANGDYLKTFIDGTQGYGIVCPSVMFRRRFMVKNQLCFNIEAGPAMDQALWFEIEKNGGKIGILESELIYYRIHSGQDSQNDIYRRIHFPLYNYLYSSKYYRNKIKKASKRMFIYLCANIYRVFSSQGNRKELLLLLDASLEYYPVNLIHNNFYGILSKVLYRTLKIMPYFFMLIIKLINKISGKGKKNGEE